MVSGAGPGTVVAIPADAADMAASAAAVAGAEAHFGQRIDTLVANAAFQNKLPWDEIPVDQWDRMMAVNLRGAYLAALVVGRRLIAESRPGAVTFIASIATLAGASRLTAYGAAKAGLAGLTRSLAVDWAEHGIRVNAVAPGWVATDLTQGLQDNPKLKQRLVDDVPMGRMAEPADIADVPVFLSSEGARYVTGSIWPVDGGLLA